MPVGLVKRATPSSVIALRLTSAKRTRSSTWLLGAPCDLQQRDDVFALVDVAGRDVDRFSITSLLDTVPDSTMFFRCSATSMVSPGNSSLTCSVKRARSRCTMTS